MAQEEFLETNLELAAFRKVEAELRVLYCGTLYFLEAQVFCRWKALYQTKPTYQADSKS